MNSATPLSITPQTLECFLIASVPRRPNKGLLDPIQVIFTDTRGKGQIIVRCFSDVWTTYFGNTGEQMLTDFIASCNNEYLANRLLHGRRPDKHETEYVQDIAGVVIQAMKERQA